MEKIMKASSEESLNLGGTVLQNEKKFDVSIVHIWTLRKGRLAKFEPFIDTPAMLAALQ